MRLKPAPAVIVALLLAACSGGGGGGGPAGPAAVASVTITAPTNSISVGQTTTLTATPKDASGNILSGRAITWSSAVPTIAGVSSSGVVTAVAVGTTVITATSESKSATTAITVTQTGPDCGTATPLSLAVGEVRTLSAAQEALLCVSGGGAGSEYALIPVNFGTGSSSISVNAISSNTTAASASPLAVSAAARHAGAGAVAGAAPVLSASDLFSPVRRRDVAFERALRLREVPLRRAVRAARAQRPSRQFSGSGAIRAEGMSGPSRITGLPTSPTVGTLVTLNANANSACSNPINRVGRVAAVSSTAIAIVDTTAPAGGFSDADFQSIATTFDTLVYPIDTAAFGAPFDMDGNGKVILFFTTAVNQLTPAGSGSVVGGFFFERDMVPRVANAVVPFACAFSNEGEMFYLPVVDPNSQFNAYFRSKADLLVEINSTTVHEFQHLINASTRYYITPEIVESEESWLNEGMSHVAEELLYLRVTGLGNRQDISFTIGTAGTRLALLNAYQLDNLARYNDYLKQTESASSYGENDDLSTRGAAWGLLRYALDQSPNAQNTYLRALVRAPTQGIPNFNNVFAHLGGLAGTVRDYVTAIFTDNTTAGAVAKYSQPSWDFRDWLPRFNSNAGRFPLVTRSLTSGVPLPLSLVRGGSAFLRFRVAAGAVGGVALTTGSGPLSTQVDAILVRTQ
ncbi:MAG: Ig domain-containing protein [Gemmatimonadetes bacterium]|nr:Ig domain-containing protein [Gemmatimonadota bacterium]